VTIMLWIAVVVLSAVVVFLVLALAGATRTVASLRRTLDQNATEDGVRPSTGLPVGSVALPIQGIGPRGTPASAAALSGRRHLVVFADPGCAACETLIPLLLAGVDHIPVVLVGRSEAGWPEPWHPTNGDIVVFDPDELIADAYGVGFTPHVFVVDEGGSIAAQGPADSIQMVERLRDQAAAIQIIHTEVSRGA